MPFAKNHNATMGVPKTVGIHSGSSLSEVHQYYEEQLTISGISKDSAGAVLVSCTVKVFETSTDRLLQTTVSDAVTGAYSCVVPRGVQHYTVMFNGNVVPPVAGVSLNTLVGV